MGRQWLREQRFYDTETLLGAASSEENFTGLAFRFQFNHLSSFSSGYCKCSVRAPSRHGVRKHKAEPYLTAKLRSRKKPYSQKKYI